jgi:hypothetical protein
MCAKAWRPICEGLAAGVCFGLRTSGPDCAVHRDIRASAAPRAGPFAQHAGARACLRRVASRWRSLRATAREVSGSTLRWFLTYCAENAALAKVHALLAAVLRDHPTLVLDTSAVLVRSTRSSTSADSRTGPAWAAIAGRSSARSVDCWRTSASACDKTDATSSFNARRRPDVYF